MDASVDAASVKVTFDTDSFTFTASTAGAAHSFTMILGGAIKPADCLIRTAGRNVEIMMFKEEVGPFWPFLDKAKTKGNKIKADWSKWVDEDEEDGKPDFDTSGFGGMANHFCCFAATHGS